MNQKILVFEAKLIQSIGDFQGYTLEVEKYLSAILNPLNNRFIDRDEAEHSKQYKQLIPYVVLRFKNQVFHYVRGKQSNETRLIGKRSIGLGGHIEQRDSKTLASNRELYLAAAEREVNEEVQVDVSYDEHIVALINDDSTDVGKVHFGILHVWDLAEPRISKRERIITQTGFASVQQLRMMSTQLESWSKIVLNIIDSEIS